MPRHKSGSDLSSPIAAPPGVLAGFKPATAVYVDESLAFPPPKVPPSFVPVHKFPGPLPPPPGSVQPGAKTPEVCFLTPEICCYPAFQIGKHTPQQLTCRAVNGCIISPLDQIVARHLAGVAAFKLESGNICGVLGVHDHADRKRCML